MLLPHRKLLPRVPLYLHMHSNYSRGAIVEYGGLATSQKYTFSEIWPLGLPLVCRFAYLSIVLFVLYIQISRERWIFEGKHVFGSTVRSVRASLRVRSSINPLSSPVKTKPSALGLEISKEITFLRLERKKLNSGQLYEEQTHPPSRLGIW